MYLVLKLIVNIYFWRFVIFKRSTRKSSWPWWTIQRRQSRNACTVTKSYATFVRKYSQVMHPWWSISELTRANGHFSVPTVKKVSTWRAISWGICERCMTNSSIPAFTAVTVTQTQPKVVCIFFPRCKSNNLHYKQTWIRRSPTCTQGTLASKLVRRGSKIVPKRNCKREMEEKQTF